MSCKSCGKTIEYICQKCGKKYTNEKYYKLHCEKCTVELPEVTIELNDGDEILIQSKTEIIEPPKEDMCGFLKRIGARPLSSRYDIEQIFKFFKEINPKSTLHMDWTCPQCVAQIYRRCKEHCGM